MCLYNRRVWGKSSTRRPWRPPPADSLSDSIATDGGARGDAGRPFHGADDRWMGADVVVACMILWSGVQAARDTISPLLGQPPKKEFVEEIERLVMAHEGILRRARPRRPRLRTRPADDLAARRGARLRATSSTLHDLRSTTSSRSCRENARLSGGDPHGPDPDGRRVRRTSCARGSRRWCAGSTSRRRSTISAS